MTAVGGDAWAAVDERIAAGERPGPAVEEAARQGLDVVGDRAERALSSVRRPCLFLSREPLAVGPGGEPISVLLAWVRGDDGRALLAGVRSAKSSSTAGWRRLLADLKRRGLRTPRLVVTDGGQAVTSAAAAEFPRAPQQTAAAQVLAKIVAKVPDHRRDEAERDFWSILDGVTTPPGAAAVRDARQRARMFAARWGKESPAAVDVLNASLPALTAYLRLPAGQWRALRNFEVAGPGITNGARPASTSREAVVPLVVETVDPETSSEPPVERRRTRRLAAVAAPVVFACAWAIVGSLALFPHLSSNHDEPVYLMQAEALRHGHLTIEQPPNAAHFRPWFVGERDGRFVFKYTPVYAGFIALHEIVFGTPRLALGTAAAAMALFVYLLGREVLGSRTLASIATWAVVLSPVTLVLSATYLSYVTSLTLLLAFAYFVLRARRDPRRWPLVLAGLFGGLAFFARPFDAFLFCAPLGGWFVWDALRKGAPQRVFAIAAGAVTPIAATLLTNAASTGNLLRFPYSVITADDAIGFGTRRNHPGEPGLEFGLAQAVEGFGRFWFWSLVCFAAGPLLWWLFARRLRWRSLSLNERLLTASAAVFLAGYFCFWGPYALSAHIWRHPLFGPMYWLPVLAVIAVIGVAALRGATRRATAAFVVVALTLTAACSVPLLARHRDISDDTARLRRAVPTDLTNALIFVPPPYGPYLMHPLGFARNRVDLSGPIVYALGLGGSDLDVVDQFRDRTAYQLTLDGGIRADGETSANALLSRVQRYRGDVFDLDLTLVNRTPEPFVEVEVAALGRVDHFLLDERSKTGTSYRIRLRLTRLGTRALSAVRDHIADATPADVFRVAARFGSYRGYPSRVVERRFVAQSESDGTVDVLSDGLTWQNDPPNDQWRFDLTTHELALSVHPSPAQPADRVAPPLGPSPPARRRR